MAAANECDDGAMHFWPEAGILETADGDLISTGLMNPYTPLIRYRTGNRASAAEEREACRCGRTLPIMGKIEGRCDDVLYTADGRTVGRLDPAGSTSRRRAAPTGSSAQ